MKNQAPRIRQKDLPPGLVTVVHRVFFHQGFVLLAKGSVLIVLAVRNRHTRSYLFLSDFCLKQLVIRRLSLLWSLRVCRGAQLIFAMQIFAVTWRLGS